MQKFILAICFLLVCSFTAMAQDTPKAEVFGGYSYTRSEFGTNLNGFNTSVTGNITDYFGITGEFGGSYINGNSFYTLMGGPRFSYRLGNVTPFAHALFGGVGVPNSGGTFSAAFGGGLDFKLTDNISVRGVQVDYLRFGTDNSLKNVRVSSGIVINFGKK
jgi:hypothetical protein